MNTTFKLKFVLINIIISCYSIFLNAQNINSAKSNAIEEIKSIEKQFESDLNAIGADFAFEKYAAVNAVIKRENDTLIMGLAAIKKYYSNPIYKNAKAEWKPDYIDVSNDKTMAYTFGKYKWTLSDKFNKTQVFTGVFHTVWKKQSDGTWKYVWD